jgi:hypothetical protein
LARPQSMLVVEVDDLGDVMSIADWFELFGEQL